MSCAMTSYTVTSVAVTRFPAFFRHQGSVVTAKLVTSEASSLLL